MSRSKFPTAKTIFEWAAMYGLAVRVDRGLNGEISSVQIMGKAGSVAASDEADVNPWDQVLNADQNQNRAS
jgi:hypothetical protein